jgi:hypothetical protein
MNDIGRCILMRIQSPTATATVNPADTNMLLWESEISRAAERALSYKLCIEILKIHDTSGTP